MAVRSRVGVAKWSCRLSGLTPVRRNKMFAAVPVVLCSAFAAAGRIGEVSWSCTGLVVAGEEAGCARRLEQQQVGFCIVVVVAEVAGLAAAVPKTSRLTVCLSHFAAN